MRAISISTPMARQMLPRIRKRLARVAVVGLGRVGLPLARAFADGGYAVTGFDVDAERVGKLREGQSYVGHVPGRRVAELLEAGRFEPTSDPRSLVAAEVIVLCVPTPAAGAGGPDLSYLFSAGRTLGEYLQAGQLVVSQSTAYPGATEEVLLPLLEGAGLRLGWDYYLAASPASEDPGHAAHPRRTPRQVVGGFGGDSLELAVALYEPVAKEVVPVSDLRAAEACGLWENTYRAVHGALANELRMVFEALGVNAWEVIETARPGPADLPAGGPLFHADPSHLTWAARRAGVPSRFAELAGEVNAAVPQYLLGRVAHALREQNMPVKASRVCVLGVANKKDGDDPRGAPALALLEGLLELGAAVSYHDPYVPSLPPLRGHPDPLHSEPISTGFLASQDCLVIVTDHSAYNFEHILRHARLVLDTRNATRGVPRHGCRVILA